MKWASAISERQPLGHAADEVLRALAADLGGVEPDLLMVFASPHHAASYADLAPLLLERWPKARVLGCSAGGVIGAGREVEDMPALSVTAASLPGVRMSFFHLDDPVMPGASATADEWRRAFRVEEPPRAVVLLPDAFTCDVDRLMAGLDAANPGGVVIGGLASGGPGPGGNALFLGAEVYRTGAVGVALSGDLRVDTVIAQGCRPIGQPMLVTRCEGQILLELGGRPPREVLEELHEKLDTRDRALFRRSLFFGIEMKDQREYKAGDFLIRNIIGMDPSTGALAVGAELRQWQAVQFHLRDAETSAEDLRAVLARYRSERPGSPRGALLFSCLGRGRGLYGRPDHDTEVFRHHLGAVPVGGFFCNGEIGPVGKTTFLHGYTSAFGLFGEP